MGSIAPRGQSSRRPDTSFATSWLQEEEEEAHDPISGGGCPWCVTGRDGGSGSVGRAGDRGGGGKYARGDVMGVCLDFRFYGHFV